MESTDIGKQFEQILADVLKMPGINPEQATSVAVTILTEHGKYARAEMANQSRQNGSYGSMEGPATDRQKDALRKFGISFSDDISKEEASNLLEEAIAKKNAKRQ